MTALREFLAMGGYGFYVWSAYGVAALVVIVLAVASRMRLNRLQQALAKVELARGPRRRP